MKINFAAIKFLPSLSSEPVVIEDINKQIADVIWQRKEVAAGKFALKLYDNPEVEVDETEMGYIREAVGEFRQWVSGPILEAMGD